MGGAPISQAIRLNCGLIKKIQIRDVVISQRSIVDTFGFSFTLPKGDTTDL